VNDTLLTTNPFTFWILFLVQMIKRDSKSIMTPGTIGLTAGILKKDYKSGKSGKERKLNK